MSAPGDAPDRPGGARRFATTQWSLVVAAGGPRTPESQSALATLCELYWYPLYAFLRRSGHSAQQSEDLVQAFFTRLIEKDVLGQADPERGRFRSFMLGALKHFVANEFDRARTQKRGGDRPHTTLDFSSAEGRYSLEPRDAVTPEGLFERQWALTLVDRVQVSLRREFAKAGKSAVFEQLKGFLTGDDDDTPYADVSKALGMSEGAVRIAVHRLRRTFRDRLRAEIQQTVESSDDIDTEIQFLRRTLGANPNAPKSA